MISQHIFHPTAVIYQLILRIDTVPQLRLSFKENVCVVGTDTELLVLHYQLIITLQNVTAIAAYCIRVINAAYNGRMCDLISQIIGHIICASYQLF